MNRTVILCLLFFLYFWVACWEFFSYGFFRWQWRGENLKVHELKTLSMIIYKILYQHLSLHELETLSLMIHKVLSQLHELETFSMMIHSSRQGLKGNLGDCKKYNYFLLPLKHILLYACWE